MLSHLKTTATMVSAAKRPSQPPKSIVSQLRDTLLFAATSTALLVLASSFTLYRLWQESDQSPETISAQTRSTATKAEESHGFASPSSPPPPYKILRKDELVRDSTTHSPVSAGSERPLRPIHSRCSSSSSTASSTSSSSSRGHAGIEYTTRKPAPSRIPVRVRRSARVSQGGLSAETSSTGSASRHRRTEALSSSSSLGKRRSTAAPMPERSTTLLAQALRIESSVGSDKGEDDSDILDEQMQWMSSRLSGLIAQGREALQNDGTTSEDERSEVERTIDVKSRPAIRRSPPKSSPSVRSRYLHDQHSPCIEDVDDHETSYFTATSRTVSPVDDAARTKTREYVNSRLGHHDRAPERPSLTSSLSSFTSYSSSSSSSWAWSSGESTRSFSPPSSPPTFLTTLKDEDESDLAAKPVAPVRTRITISRKARTNDTDGDSPELRRYMDEARKLRIARPGLVPRRSH